MSTYLRKILLILLPVLLFLTFISTSFPTSTKAESKITEEIFVINKSDNLEMSCFNGHYYTAIGKSGKWKDAKAYCEEFGGHLATITSKEENDFIFSKLKALSISNCWIGATDSVKEGTWKWVTGEAFSYTNWMSGEPNKSGDGLQFYIKNGFWDDTDNTLSWILCEWDKNPLPYDAQFISCSKKELNGAMIYNNHLYKVFSEQKTWNDAKKYCNDLGGHLATITSQEEDKQLFKYSNIMGYNTILLGASDDEQEGTWKWVTGEPFDYTNFNSGEPNNSNNEDYLQYYTMSGGWNDTKQSSCVFLCEWSDVCIVGNELKLSHKYEKISEIGPTCQTEGLCVEKCARCSDKKETTFHTIACQYSEWKTVSGSVLFPPITKEKTCVYCGKTQKQKDYSYVWLTISVGAILIISTVKIVNYIKSKKANK